MMPRRAVLAASVLASFALVAALAGVVGAKEGMEAQLHSPISLATPPGTTIDVTWDVHGIEGATQRPITGAPAFIRLVPSGGGKPSEAFGIEDTKEPGTYHATLVVPAGGIARVEVGMRGRSCDAASCGSEDIVFPLTDDALVTGTAVQGVTAASPDPQAPRPAVAAPAVAVGPGFVPVVGVGLAIALLAAVMTFVGRRRIGRRRASV